MITKLLPIFLLVAGAGRAAAAEQEIRAVLDRQAAGWNRGSTDAFFEGVAPDTTFVGDTGSHGLKEVRERYQRRYPTPAAMGRLTFSEVEVHMLGSEHAFVTGRWKLERSKDAGGDVGGLYSLVFAKSP